MLRPSLDQSHAKNLTFVRMSISMVKRQERTLSSGSSRSALVPALVPDREVFGRRGVQGWPGGSHLWQGALEGVWQHPQKVSVTFDKRERSTTSKINVIPPQLGTLQAL